MLVGQAQLVRRAIPLDLLLLPPLTDGLYGAQYAAKGVEPVRFAMLGDSSAAGVGAELAEQAPGSLLATGLAEALQQPIQLTALAVSGAQSQHLHAQVDKAIEADIQLVGILIGGNDVIARVRPAVAVRHLEQAVRRLRAHGMGVVVGTCPDMSSIEPVRPPLRWLVRRWCRELAAAQTIAVVAAGGRTVSLGDLLADQFARRPREMFAIDRFHPSAAGYELAAEVMLPSLLATLGYSPELAPTPSSQWSQASVPRQGVRSLEHAAAEAASTAGTEVAPVAEETRQGRPGLWGELRNRLSWITDLVPTERRPEPILETGRDAKSTVDP